ncbi:MAG: hypothetical protein AAFP03_13250, partial [Cyanobacteria bacterium J06598_3]
FESPGAHLTYRVVGPCCRLYDREQLPWPSCRIQWHSKEPSWRRIGRRFIADMATRKHPSYSVEIVGQSYRSEPVVMTLYTEALSAECKNWWHTKRLSSEAVATPTNPGTATVLQDQTQQVKHQPVAIPPADKQPKSLAVSQPLSTHQY